jgi:enamine deaminase RidA (YjgF/YER057c/UK114 family)
MGGVAARPYFIRWNAERGLDAKPVMAITLVGPDGLPQVDIYQQVSVATSSKLIFIAGQVVRTADGEPIGAGDLAAQVEQCYINLALRSPRSVHLSTTSQS